MVSWKDFCAQFRVDYDALKGDLLEPGCIECGPFLKTTSMPNRAPWRLNWAVIFNDGNYVRIKECYRAFQGSKIGARNHFSYHYGPANPKRDADGIPLIGKGSPKPNLRIDIDRHSPHIHTNGEDHIGQVRVIGFNIENADMVQFLRAVIDHRKDPSKALTQLLKISVRPK